MQSNSSKTLVDIHSGLGLAKCPHWNRERLLFLDIHDRRIKSTDLAGTVRVEKTLSFLPGAFVVPGSGGCMVADVWRREVLHLENDRQAQVADLSGITRSCLSDGIVSTQAGTYVGAIGFDHLDPLVDPVSSGIIMHIENGGSGSLVADDLFFPNGMVVTPDERTLIVAEAFGHVLTAFDIGKDGSLSDRRVWAKLPNDVKPDGICLDSEGAIWTATATPRALRILEGGEIVDEIIAERAVFAVTLGGPQRQHLFLCTSASSDPVITRLSPGAAIEFAMVNVPGLAATHDELPIVSTNIR